MSAPVEVKLPLDHVAIAVTSLEEACSLYELLSGETRTKPEVLEAQGVRVSFVGSIEFLEPLTPETSVGRFISARGPSLHHIAYRTSDIVSEISRLKKNGFEVIDPKPRPGARGHLVSFLYPSSTAGILIELVQHPS